MRVVKKVCIICGHVHNEHTEREFNDDYKCPECGTEAIMFEDQEIEI